MTTRHKQMVSCILLALHGTSVVVKSRFARESDAAMRRYLTVLDGYEGWMASKANRVIRFEGGGSIRFVSVPHDLDGVDPDMIVYE